MTIAVVFYDGYDMIPQDYDDLPFLDQCADVVKKDSRKVFYHERMVHNDPLVFRVFSAIIPKNIEEAVMIRLSTGCEIVDVDDAMLQSCKIKYDFDFEAYNARICDGNGLPFGRDGCGNVEGSSSRVL